MYEQIIVIVGMPRSGTSWLSQIIDSCQEVRFRLSPFFSYAFKNAVTETSTKEEYKAVFDGAYLAHDDFMEQTRNRERDHYPTFEQKNTDAEYLAIKMTRFHNLIPTMLKYFENMKMVAIVRHPCGVIHSWLTTPKEFPQNADPRVEWRTGKCRKTGPEEFWGFEDWKAVTRLHVQLEKEYPGNFFLMQYEDLVNEPVAITKELFRFLGLVYTSQAEEFLVDSQNRHDNDPYATFKHPGVKDRWRSSLQPQIQTEIIREIEQTDLERFLK
ncbi:sulfotransferase [Candidatus Neomarinimicrobiota bacterium]